MAGAQRPDLLISMTDPRVTSESTGCENRCRSERSVEALNRSCRHRTDGARNSGRTLVAPRERHVSVANAESALKADIRNYAYAGSVKLVAARLYQGQTTDFRTPGGGFAPVLTTAEGKTIKTAEMRTD
jgi:hypothetical protein